MHNISIILSSNLRDLDNIFIKQDISVESWINNPVIDLSGLQEDERCSSSATNSDQNIVSGTNSWTDSDPESNPDAGLFRLRITSRAPNEHSSSGAQPEQYQSLIEQIIQSAQSTLDRDNRIDPTSVEFTYFDRVATFGVRETNEFAYNRRIGAAGEAFVSYL